MTDYTTLALVKQELGITGSDNDSRLSALITQASSMIEAYCGRTFESKTLTENVRGYGHGSFLRVSHAPITSITSIIIEGYTVPASEYGIESAGAGMIYGNWRDTAPLRYAMGQSHVAGRERRLYEVTYTGGYVVSGEGKNLPAAIERACIELVRGAYWMAGQDSRIKSESVDGVGSASYHDMSALSVKHVSHFLTPYCVTGALL